ncbi:MAG: hypothetical protein PHY34_03940, partial [Patescibacteria group bacterium]|nr:hypothetical protein [Patescibacteria group bacterium]
RFNRPSVQRIGKLPRAQKDTLLLAVAICQTSNSNTATIVKNRMLIGNGTTRPDRVDANELAVDTAHEQGHGTTGAVCVNDSFFPFPDGAAALIDDGIKVILTVSGSVAKGGGDDALLSLMKETNTTLIWLPVGEGRLFFGH